VIDNRLFASYIQDVNETGRDAHDPAKAAMALGSEAGINFVSRDYVMTDYYPRPD